MLESIHPDTMLGVVYLTVSNLDRCEGPGYKLKSARRACSCATHR